MYQLAQLLRGALRALFGTKHRRGLTLVATGIICAHIRKNRKQQSSIRPQITTVTDEEAVLHYPATAGNPARARRIGELKPNRRYRIDGVSFRTLPRPRGRLLARFATVNDLHFGEAECGRIVGINLGAPLTSAPGEKPYPLVMNEAAAEEIQTIEPAVVIAKGDLTDSGTPEELAQFHNTYGAPFGDKLLIEPGNHDVHNGNATELPEMFSVTLPGVILALVDTTIAGKPGGQISAQALDWLEELGRNADRPVLVFGHHPVFKANAAVLYGLHYLINRRDSKRLVDLFASNKRFLGYFAGHTHRNKVRRFRRTGAVPFAEIGSTKEWPGNWAEYRVFEGGIQQLVWRISSEEALAWSERTRTEMLARVNWIYQRLTMGKMRDRCFAMTHRR